ncbi:hypothetical protein Tco_0930333 [Tanacetum coccineum]
MIDSCLENIGHVHILIPPPVPFEQLLDDFMNPRDELLVDDSESDTKSYETPLVSPFLDSDDESDDGEVINELNEYGNAWNFYQLSKGANSLQADDLEEEPAPTRETSAPPAPKTAKQLAAKRNQERVKSILLLAIPDEYLLKFHNVADAKSLWEAIKSRFGGNEESKKMQKNVLKHQFENFSTTSNESLDKAYDRFQKLISQLEVHGAPISKEDINQKFLRSLPPSWNQIALIMRNKPDIDEINIDDLGEDVDVHVYRSMIGSLMYLTASRPDIMFAICACARFQVTPKASYLNAVKRIFRYLKHQPKLGLWYPRDSPFKLEAFLDSDYGGANLDRKSTTSGCQFLESDDGLWFEKGTLLGITDLEGIKGKDLMTFVPSGVLTRTGLITPVKQNEKRAVHKVGTARPVSIDRPVSTARLQTIVANYTTEAEYVAAAYCYGQVLWIQNQMMDYGFNFMNTKIHIDNESTTSVIKNPVAHSRTKHIEIRFHYIRDCYEKRLIEVIKLHTDSNVADLLTKGFDVTQFNFLVVSIGMLNL